jgi:hypothetical protein
VTVSDWSAEHLRAESFVFSIEHAFPVSTFCSGAQTPCIPTIPSSTVHVWFLIVRNAHIKQALCEIDAWKLVVMIIECEIMF